MQDICRQQNISNTTVYKWKAKFGGMEVSDARRLRSLEDENRKLKTIVADLTLDVQALRALTSKNFLSPRPGAMLFLVEIPQGSPIIFS